MTFAMCWGFLVSWMPYAVVSMWTAYGDPTMLPTRITVMAVLTAKTSTVINPTIYFMMSRKFRPMLAEVFRGNRRNSHSVFIEQNTPETIARKVFLHSSKFSDSQSSSDMSTSSELRTIRIKGDSSSSSIEVNL